MNITSRFLCRDDVVIYKKVQSFILDCNTWENEAAILAVTDCSSCCVAHALLMRCDVGERVCVCPSHRKGPVVLVVLDYIHEVASQCFQEVGRVHLCLDLQFGTQAVEKRTRRKNKR